MGSNRPEQLLHKILDVAADAVLGERVANALARALKLLAFLQLDIGGDAEGPALFNRLIARQGAARTSTKAALAGSWAPAFAGKQELELARKRNTAIRRKAGG